MSEFNTTKEDNPVQENSNEVPSAFEMEHYKRCKEFYLSYNTSIWSMPSLALAINVGAYYALFDMNKRLPDNIQELSLFILILLNLALTIGLNKHLYFQRQFGNKLVQLERNYNIDVVDLEGSSLLTKIPAGNVYVGIMIFITLISLGILLSKF